MKKSNVLDTTLEELLKKELSAASFEALPATLKITKARFTRLLRNPSTATIQEVSELAKVLHKPPVGLIVGYRLGWDTLTLNEVEKIGKVIIES